MGLQKKTKKEETIDIPIVRSIVDLRSTIGLWRAAGETIGLVPTMGALHEGHLALVHASREKMDCTVATILVNPLQFSHEEDLSSYPRDEVKDANKLAEAGADLLYAPPVKEIYPEDFLTKVHVMGLTDVLCGVFRPVHFSGVATVVTKLFLQALPDAAFFGEKDYQQALVVRRLVRDLDIPVRVETVPTVRETDGLALSSRNAYLTAEEREIAPKLFETLSKMVGEIRGGRSIEKTVSLGEAMLLRAGFRSIDYLEVRDPQTLALVNMPNRPARIFVAVHLGKARLIDNVSVTD